MYLPQEITQEQQQLILIDYTRLEEADIGTVLSTLYRLGSDHENLLGNIIESNL